MKYNRLVTFIVPVYNVRDYVGAALEDVCRQTYQNLQIIVIDDGSTDGSGELCDQYARKDGRVCVFHQENKGLSAARNIGIEHARGEYIFFLDSDDRIHPQIIEIMVNSAEMSGSSIVQSRVYAFLDDSDIPRMITSDICPKIYSP